MSGSGTNLVIYFHWLPYLLIPHNLSDRLISPAQQNFFLRQSHSILQILLIGSGGVNKHLVESLLDDKIPVFEKRAHLHDGRIIERITSHRGAAVLVIGAIWITLLHQISETIQNSV
jgi:hypothetical protein